MRSHPRRLDGWRKRSEGIYSIYCAAAKEVLEKRRRTDILRKAFISYAKSEMNC